MTTTFPAAEAPRHTPKPQRPAIVMGRSYLRRPMTGATTAAEPARTTGGDS